MTHTNQLKQGLKDMGDNVFSEEIDKRRTFAIISHPDAGKTTVTEKLLLICGVINSAGTIRARKSSKHATSDWMAIEQERGISVTSSVMQFEYRNHVLNLLDTPGHEDFSEDTYRTLTAVDSALMVIDAARGVEERTIKLLEVCREQNTPIVTFINKLDRSARDPLDLIDEIESVLKIKCAPLTWPIGSGQDFEGLYDFNKNVLLPYQRTSQVREGYPGPIAGIGLQDASTHPHFSRNLEKLHDDIELLQGAGTTFDKSAYLEARLTPVFFGTALRNFGLQEMLDCFVENAPAPQPRQTNLRNVEPSEPAFSGFVFKIQANMDPNHRDRIAFIRICSGKYEEGKRLVNVRSKKETQIKNAIRFMAKGRRNAKTASPGDILGFYNHGTIQVGDTFTEGEHFNFKGIPNFAPEIFRLVRTADPLKTKALSKGLKQLCEEGAVQVFNYLDGNQVVLGAVGSLQFDVVAWRLKNEYAVECAYSSINITTARWLFSDTPNRLDEIKKMETNRLALDGVGRLAYLAPTTVNLQLAEERWPDIQFSKTREMGE